MAHPARMPLTPAPGYTDNSETEVESPSALSWAAIVGGGFVAAATSFVLLVLGTGIGLSSVSPWSGGSVATAVGVAAIVWLVLTQIVASAMGGYLAGRLRTKWVRVHTDEVYFRDTAHGFLVWAVGLVVTAAFLAGAATAIAGHVAQGAASAPSVNDPNAYFIDGLLRSDATSLEQNNSAAVRSEIGAIFSNDLRQPDFPAADKTYLAKLVAARTGVSQTDAEKRVSESFEAARQSAEATRKAGAHLAYWTFFALLVGAFCASFSATVGGKQRDHSPIP